jgi:predicted Zn-dependent protease
VERLCATRLDNAALASLAKRLAEGDAEAPSFELKVYDIDIVNAFALPGDRIVVTKKLIETAETPEEIAGVLAHEMGHVYHRHAETQMVRAMGIELLFRITSSGDLGGFAGLLAILRYSRDSEREADSFAVDQLRKVAINPVGLKRFFERVMKLEGNPPSSGGVFATVNDMMSTHPVTKERMDSIEPEGMATRPVLSDSDWASLKMICK